VAILQLHALKPTCHSLPWGTQLSTANYQLNHSAISSQPPLQSSTELPTLNIQSFTQQQKLTAGNQSARSILAPGPAGTHGHIFVQCQDLCFADLGSSLYRLRADTTENTAFNSSSIAGVFTDPLPRSGRLLIRLSHSNGCTCYNIYGVPRNKSRRYIPCGGGVEYLHRSPANHRR
jgi:hypothetical protein